MKNPHRTSKIKYIFIGFILVITIFTLAVLYTQNSHLVAVHASSFYPAAYYTRAIKPLPLIILMIPVFLIYNVIMPRVYEYDMEKMLDNIDKPQNPHKPYVENKISLLSYNFLIFLVLLTLLFLVFTSNGKLTPIKWIMIYVFSVLSLGTFYVDFKILKDDYLAHIAPLIRKILIFIAPALKIGLIVLCWWLLKINYYI